MAIFQLEDATTIMHLIKESGRDKKGRPSFTTKCGAQIERECANVTGWGCDVTCPQCSLG